MTEVQQCEKIWSSFRITTREDPELDGLSQEDTRRLFIQWVSTIPDLDRRSQARYHYFMHVNKDVLNKFEAAISAADITDGHPNYVRTNVVAIVVEAQTIGAREDMDDEEEEKSMAWQYVHAYSIPT